jgi:hypothetical protein
MPGESDRAQILKTHIRRAEVRMWAINAITFALGAVGLYGRQLLRDPWAELMRDAGIAFIIAAVVTLTYEAYARQRSAAETVEDLLGKVIGDIVDPKTWDEVRGQILDRAAIRRAMTVRIRLERRDGVPTNQLVLWASTEYRLASLRSHEHAVHVLHFLDAYMSNATHNLPRFVRAVLNGDRIEFPPDAARLELNVALPRRGTGDIPIVIEREEVVYFPGAYTLIMSDLTELESVELWEAPSDVKVEINCIFDERFVEPGKSMRPGRVLLPGQCIEIRLTGRAIEPHKATA